MRNVRRIGFTVGFALAVAGCGSSSSESKRESTVAAHRAGCPEEGARVPFAQLLAQTDQFKGCEVTTDVAFLAAGSGQVGVGTLFDTSGQTVFRVLAPGQGQTGAMGLSDGNFVSLPNAAAAPVFTAASGAKMTLRGRMELRKMMWVDQGNYSRLFRARTITVGEAATAAR